MPEHEPPNPDGVNGPEVGHIEPARIRPGPSGPKSDYSDWPGTQAQPYTTTRSVIACGGGGSLAAGPYALNATIGQLAAAPPLSAAAYELTTGFWNASS